MNAKIDIKSALAGMLLGGILVLSVAAATQQNTSTQRFELLATSNDGLFKIDTATGQVWKTSISSPESKFTRPNIAGELSLEENRPATR
jgi:hypothetical protein